MVQISCPKELNPLNPLRLHLNENTAGCSPAVTDALRSMTPEEIARYPDYDEINARCERWFGVPSGWVRLTNGLDEGLHIAAQQAQHAARAAGNDRATAIIVEPAFQMYAIYATAADLEIVRVMSGEDFAFPLEAVLHAISPRTALVNLTDPNNPTGLPMPPGAIETIARAAPHAIVLVDEAYADFSGRSFIGQLAQFPHIIIGRTFAKGHGLAGLRIGALIGHTDTLAPIHEILPPFNLNACGVRALAAALEDRAQLAWYVAQSAASRELIYEFSRTQELTCWPSQTNFVLVRVGDRAAALTAALASRGVLVQDRSPSPGCRGCLRIAAGVVSHTEYCLELLGEELRRL
jgi:histidinol-phosphate aminotransferase